MIKPQKAHFNIERGTVNLYFPRDPKTGEIPWSEYYLKGGICFPIPIQSQEGDTDVQGYVLMAGVDQISKVITIFEEIPFLVINNIVALDGTLEFKGVGPEFNRIWAKYYAKDYYFHQHLEAKKQYLLEILRTRSIEPKPAFIEVPWDTVEEAMHIVWKNIKTGKLRYQKDGQLHRELGKVEKGDKEIFPSVYALQVLLAGLERFPYRGR